MGKNKRNKRNRDQHTAGDSLHRFLHGADLDEANRAVREAEANLLEARRRAAQAADAIRAAQSRPAHAKIDLDDAHGHAPEDQAAAFFNRPGDYYLARLSIRDKFDHAATVATADTVLKASEDQRDYLLEVLRQIRGGFGDLCRIELYRTHTVEHGPQAPNKSPGTTQATAGAGNTETQEAAANDTYAGVRLAPGSFTVRDGRPIPMSEFHLGERYSSADAGHDPHPPTDTPYTDQIDGQVPPWVAGTPGAGFTLPPTNGRRDLTREEIQAQLPGMTRAQAAAELGKHPEDIGGNVYATGDLQREQIAAELGIPVENLLPIKMSNGGHAYSVLPTPPPEPEGRHAKPEGEASDER